jgi:hypothetical protein
MGRQGILTGLTRFAGLKAEKIGQEEQEGHEGNINLQR